MDVHVHDEPLHNPLIAVPVRPIYPAQLSGSAVLLPSFLQQVLSRMQIHSSRIQLDIHNIPVE